MINIAIYSRKSVFTGKGESIEAQIDSCKKYCNSYLNDEQPIKYILYADEGFSGKNTNRPKFKKMITDIRNNKINILICYRLDRISRNVADFSSILELLQKYKVNFISIKERFDTSTPLGRAMIYIASVFAQLERETIAERVHDNMIKLAQLGRWLGGNTPYGFNIDKKTFLTNDLKQKTFSVLIPNEHELRIVKFIYNCYIKNNSIRDVARNLDINLINGKKGGHIDITNVRRILRNPLYVMSDNKSHEYLKSLGINVFGTPNGNGYITYNKNTKTSSSYNIKNWIASVSNHKGIIPSDEWISIQHQLDRNRTKIPRIGTGKNHSLFTGILKCKKCGLNMIIKFSGRDNNNISYEYYVCSGKQNRFTDKCITKNIPVTLLDSEIINKLNVYNQNILLSTLQKSLVTLNINFEDERITNIQSQIKENELLMNNLIKQLSKVNSESVSDKILKEIFFIDKTIKDLNIQLTSLKSTITSTTSNSITRKHLINSLKNLSTTLNYVEDISKKRFLIQTIVKYAIWDSDNNNINIILK